MRDCPITAAQVQRRQQHVRECHTDIAAITESAIHTAKDSKTRESLIEQFFGMCDNTEIAEKCLPQLVKYMNETTDGRAFFAMVTAFKEQIAPVIEDVQKAYTDIGKLKNEAAYKGCYEALSDSAAIDRMLNNHNLLSKRFDVNGYIIEHQFYNVEDVTATQLCEWIDTYDMPAKHKVSIALEEAAYLFGKSGLEYDMSKVVQSVVEYFLLTKTANSDTIKTSLLENRFISTHDVHSVDYLFNEIQSDDVQSVIDQCKKDDRFNDGMFKSAINKIYARDAASIINDTPNVLRWIRKMVVMSTLGLNVVLGAVALIADQYIQMKMDRKQTDRILRNFNQEKEATQKAIDKESDEERKRNLQKYMDSIDEAISKINVYKDTLYTYDEISKQSEIEQEAASSVPVTLDEFSNFKFDKIAKTADDASNYIKKTYSKKPGKIQYKPESMKFKDALAEGFKSISSHFTEALIDSNINIFDAVLATFNVSEAKADEIFGFVTGLTEDVANRYENGTIKLYTNTSGGMCEIHMVDSTPVMLTESEMEKYGDYFNKFELTTVKEMLHLTKMIDAYVQCDPENILRDLCESNLGFEEAYTIMDIYKYSGILDEDAVWDKLVEKYTHKNYDSNNYQMVNENTRMNNLEYEFNGDLPFDIELEACQLMRGILNESLDMSGVKVALQGMKSKVKNLSVKEKEMSRDMDVAASGFMRSVENALTNNRREAIIKGSIIPSFSKCIKTAIAGAGIAAIVNPTCAVISLMGMLATSRYLNNRERMLLLDEIEVELKVVDKELQMAESEGDMQKYRKLLTYQKKLKKEDFKLRYNISRKMGKDYITKKGDQD